MKHSIAFVALLACLTMMLTGCSNSNFGEVTGQVTIDGQPAPDRIQVVFEPQVEGASYSEGVTRDGGNYEMYYTRDQKGVMVGKSIVRLRLPEGFSDGPEGSGTGSEALDNLRIPGDFSLEVEIKPGKNVIPIEVTTK